MQMHASTPPSSVVTYLSDHFAGPMFAIAEAERVLSHVTDEALATFLGRFVSELRAERDVLHGVIEALGSSPIALKAMTGWLAEKATLFKLSGFTTLSLFESLETLRLGVQGKRGPWAYLTELARLDARLQGFDLAPLVRQSDEQIDPLEAFRREAGLALAREEGAIPRG